MTPRKPPPKEETAETDETEEGEKNEQPAPPAGDKPIDSGSFEGQIRQIVQDVVGPLLDVGGRSGRGTAADDEDRLARLVRDAQAKLKAEEEKEGRFTKVEETLKAITEKPPARDGILGKVQRFMWGGE